MSTLRYTNGILTLIAVCLVALVAEHYSIIPAAQAQPATPPTPVVIVGWQLQKPLPVNLTGLSGHKSVPVAIVSQDGNVAVQVASPVEVKNASDGSALAVKNPSDGTALTVKVVKPSETPKP
jgi:hypothetical protein